MGAGWGSHVAVQSPISWKAKSRDGNQSSSGSDVGFVVAAAAACQGVVQGREGAVGETEISSSSRRSRSSSSCRCCSSKSSGGSGSSQLQVLDRNSCAGSRHETHHTETYARNSAYPPEEITVKGGQMAGFSNLPQSHLKRFAYLSVGVRFSF